MHNFENDVIIFSIQLRESQLEYFEAAGVPPKRKLMEFPVSEDALLPIGTRLSPYLLLEG